MGACILHRCVLVFLCLFPVRFQVKTTEQCPLLIRFLYGFARLFLKTRSSIYLTNLSTETTFSIV